MGAIKLDERRARRHGRSRSASAEAPAAPAAAANSARRSAPAIRHPVSRVLANTAAPSAAVVPAASVPAAPAALGASNEAVPGPEPLPATFIAHLAALDERGQAWVLWDDAEPGASGGPPQAVPARTTIALAPEHVGRELLVCRAGRAAQPIIVGVLLGPGGVDPAAQPSIDLIVERRRITFAASTEVVLRCGQGSITLSADGKVALRGLDIVSTATRTQRIRGGSVRIN